jgi:hypothetical protein
LPIAKKNSIKLFGQCLNNITIQRLDSLINQQCTKSSIDCSVDYCEPDSFKSFSSGKITILTKTSNESNNHTIGIILSIIFSIIAVIIILIIIILIYRWRKGKNLLCCDFLPTKPLKMNEITRRQHQKQIIDNNPTVIESVITHGANMNVPSYPNQNSVYSNETTSNTKRKLYNPMFTDSPTSDIRYHQSNHRSFQNNQLYSENL